VSLASAIGLVVGVFTSNLEVTTDLVFAADIVIELLIGGPGRVLVELCFVDLKLTAVGASLGRAESESRLYKTFDFCHSFGCDTDAAHNVLHVLVSCIRTFVFIVFEAGLGRIVFPQDPSM
jgi:hypothetical protein